MTYLGVAVDWIRTLLVSVFSTDRDGTCTIKRKTEKLDILKIDITMRTSENCDKALNMSLQTYLFVFSQWYIDNTNQEGRTRSGINTSASPDPSAGPEGAHEGLDWHKC